MVSDGGGQGKVTKTLASTSWGAEGRVEGCASTDSVLFRRAGFAKDSRFLHSCWTWKVVCLIEKVGPRRGILRTSGKHSCSPNFMYSYVLYML